MHNPNADPAGAERPAPPRKKLFIGLPIYAQCPAHFMACMLAFQRNTPECLGDEVHVELCQGDGVARSRNQLAAQFLRSDCTHFLMIDCDLMFDPSHVARMIEHDVPIVGGLYPKKQDGPIEWVLNTNKIFPPDERGLQKVMYIGTGFLMIRRDVLEHMAKAFPESRFREDYGHRGMANDFFPMAVYRKNAEDEGRYLSEDWFFCQRATDLGYDILADTKVVLKHLGPAIYPNASQEIELFARGGADVSQAPHAAYIRALAGYVGAGPAAQDSNLAPIQPGAATGASSDRALADGASQFSDPLTPALSPEGGEGVLERHAPRLARELQEA